MIDIATYIKLILKKKKLTNVEFCNRLNEVEKTIGDSRSSPQNITNYLNGSITITSKWLVKVEKALDLPFGYLLNHIEEPHTNLGKNELKNFIKKVRGI